jgi:hypothetical protein
MIDSTSSLDTTGITNTPVNPLVIVNTTDATRGKKNTLDKHSLPDALDSPNATEAPHIQRENTSEPESSISRFVKRSKLVPTKRKKTAANGTLFEGVVARRIVKKPAKFRDSGSN